MKNIKLYFCFFTLLPFLVIFGFYFFLFHQSSSSTFTPIVSNFDSFKTTTRWEFSDGDPTNSPQAQISNSSKKQEYLDFLIPLLLKMKVLEITRVLNPFSKLSFEFSRLSKIPITTLKTLTWQQLEAAYKKDDDSDFYYFSKNVIDNFNLPFRFGVKNVLALIINKIWTPWLHILQKVSSLGLPNITHITVKKEKVDVSSLVSFKVPEASSLPWEQLKILKKLQLLTLSKLQTQVQTWIDTSTQSIDDDRIKNHYGNELNDALEATFFGVQQLKAIEGDKEYTYPVDLLATTITQLMLKQNKTLNVVNLNELQGTSRWQLLNLLNVEGKLKHGKTLVYNGWNQINILNKNQEYLDFLIPLLLKMKVLEITQVSHPSSKLSFEFSRLSKIPITTLKTLTWQQLDAAYKKDDDSDFYYFSENVMYNFVPTFGLEYKTALTFTINKIWNSWLNTPQKARGLSLTHLTVGKERIDVSSLVSSDFQETSDLSLEQLQTLKKLQIIILNLPEVTSKNLQTIGLQKLESAIQTWIDFHLDFFKTKIQSILEILTKLKVNQVEINGVSYQVDLLLKNTNLQLSGSQLPENAKNQLLVLVETKISPQKLAQSFQDKQNILAFQKNWDVGKVSSYLLWLPVFDIKWVKLSKNQVVPIGALANAIQSMLTAEKFDFTKLSGEARKQLLNLLNTQGKIRAEKTFQDDVWRQIKNHQTWKAIEGSLGQLVLESIRTLLLEIQDLGINKVAHSFFPEGYDLSFLKDDKSWKKISFKDLLQGMKVAVNGTYVEFYSHLFPKQVVFQVPMKQIPTIFSVITITSMKTALKEAIATKLDSYKATIQPSLIAYAKVRVHQFKIGDQVYQIDHLTKLTNLYLPGSQLSPDAKIQLKVLLMVPITAQQLDEILIKILASQEQQLKSTQDLKLKPLIIALSVAGSALVLSVLGGFLYWFFKIKK